jgi:hypothetical protein
MPEEKASRLVLGQEAFQRASLQVTGANCSKTLSLSTARPGRTPTSTPCSMMWVGVLSIVRGDLGTGGDDAAAMRLERRSSGRRRLRAGADTT